MKSRPLIILLVLLFAFRPASHAQDDSQSDTIRVTTTLHPDGTKTVTQNNPDDRTVETSNYDAADKLLQKIVYNVDELGQAVTGSLYMPKGVSKTGAPLLVLVYKMKYKHDGLNRVSEVENYSPADQLVTRQVFHYDPSNRVIKIDTYDAAGNIIATPSNSEAVPDKRR